MSTYVYLECLDHAPPLRSYDEVGQHLYDLPRIRKEIAMRDHFVEIDKLDNPTDYGHFFTRHAVTFLVQHPKCRIGIRDEYGREHPVVVDDNEQEHDE